MTRTPVAGTPDKRAWERPGAYEVVPGVHRIPLPLPGDALHAVNVYALVDADEVVLVDSGWALKDSEAQLERALASLDRDLGSVSRFLITHVHRDHYTQAVIVRRRLGTRVCLGLGERPTLEMMLTETGVMPRELAQKLTVSGAQELLTAMAESPVTDPVDPEIWQPPDEWLRGGTRLRAAGRDLDVIETPGHTRGHVVFHDPAAGLLFAGDHVLPHITPSIGFESAPLDSPLTAYLASLRVVAALTDSMLLPAHGPVLPSTAHRTAALLAHHDRRLADTEGAVSAGRATAYEVAQFLLWTGRGRSFTELDVFNRMIAVNETLAHLDVLVELARANVATVDGVRRYSV